MKLTTQQAAQATGKSRSTIWRAAKSGMVSAERTATGDFVIDVAELDRVFGPLNHPDTSHQGSTKPHETVGETSALRREVAFLREQIGIYRKQIEALKADKSDASSAIALGAPRRLMLSIPVAARTVPARGAAAAREPRIGGAVLPSAGSARDGTSRKGRDRRRRAAAWAPGLPPALPASGPRLRHER